MTNEIRQKIEQIKNGEIPEGYRYSRAGLCPNDWNKGVLSDVLYNEQRVVPKPQKSYWRIGIRSHAKGTFHERVGNPETIDMDKLYVVKENDLILNITFAWEHAVALADKNDDGLLVSHRFPTYVFREEQNPIFYKNVVAQERFKEMLVLISPGGAGRNRVMSKKDFLRLPCNIPSYEEQQKIAEILMQCDKVIELKKKRIEEEKKLKKWLLRRFFDKKDAQKKKIGDLCLVTMGQSPDSKSYNTNKEGVALIQGNADILNREPNPKNYTNAPTKMCEIDDILLSVRAPVGAVCKTNIIACLGRGMCSIRPYADSEYIYQFLLHYEDKWQKISQGSTFESVSGEEIKKILVPINENIEFISGVLMQQDKKIALLHGEFKQWQQKKKSLMQLLLTGIVRVKI